MEMVERRKQGALKNKLLRYQVVIDYYFVVKAENKYITIVDLHKDFIYPKFYISRVTLYNILATPITKQLKEIELIEKNQLNLFG